MSGALERLRDVIAREGPITFAEFMEVALYGEPDGFFASGGGAGRAGADFVTSPEVGPLFGALVARALDDTWLRLGEPDPFVVVDAGAGRGRLLADVLRAEPRCGPAIRAVAVERSPALRARAAELLTLEPPNEVLGPSEPGDRDRDGGDGPVPVPRAGPIVTALDDLPAVDVEGVVIANELLDNLGVRLVERARGAWSEVRVGIGPGEGGEADESGDLVEVLVPAPPDLVLALVDVLGDEGDEGRGIPDGTRLPVPTGTAEWLERCAAMLHRGELWVIDYADELDGLVRRGQHGPQGWLRTYRTQHRGTSPLAAPGSQDITCDVVLPVLRARATRVGFEVAADTTQREWLTALGVGVLVAQGAKIWQERAHLGDLEALAGRSRSSEAEALLDPAGLGGHRVLLLRRVTGRGTG